MSIHDFMAAQENVVRNILAELDKVLIGRVEEIEGRVPTNAEITKHGLRVIWPNGKVQWLWKKQVILEQN